MAASCGRATAPKKGTTLVKDIFPGSYTDYYGGYYAYGSEPKYLTNVGGTLFFAAYNDTNGVELWKSDGTADGTVMVADINPEGYSSIPHNLTNVDGTLFFAADDGTGGFELWRSDGAADGTVMVADINPGISGSYPQYLTNADGTLFFLANDGTRGTQLWQSDGTPGGTAMVVNSAGNASSSPASLTNVNGTLYFSADDGTHDAELWKSDGTAGGTTLVKDLFPGSPGLSLNNLTNVDGTVFFSAQGRLWSSDGTADGTIPLGGGYGSRPAHGLERHAVLLVMGRDEWKRTLEERRHRGRHDRGEGHFPRRLYPVLLRLLRRVLAIRPLWLEPQPPHECERHAVLHGQRRHARHRAVEERWHGRRHHDGRGSHPRQRRLLPALN